jgi:uncharacterized protein YuzE
MEKTAMRLSIDHVADILAIRFREDRSYEESEEVEPGVILDFDTEGQLIGIEILDFSKRLAGDTTQTTKDPPSRGRRHPPQHHYRRSPASREPKGPTELAPPST